jgi:glycosyltransferase involved in cell wall biosynthesis
MTLEEDGWVHVFSGIRRRTPIRSAFERAIGARRTVGLMSETADWRGLGGAARRAIGIADRIRFGDGVAFVLAIGSRGVHWYRGLGYPKSRVLPYAYFVDPPPVAPRPPGGVLRIVFAGRLVHLKGVDLLLKALATVNLPPWQLTVVGDGEERGRLGELATRLHLERVNWRGATSPEASAAEIGAGDVLVLPSRQKEGWGVVVNEALLQGVPVVCSDYCGAADLVGPDRGEVVPAGDAIALARGLERVLTGQSMDSARIRRWAHAAIGPGAGAQYFQAILNHVLGGGPSPLAPWLLQ